MREAAAARMSVLERIKCEVVAMTTVVLILIYHNVIHDDYSDSGIKG